MTEEEIMLCEEIAKSCKKLRLSQRIAELCRTATVEEMRFILNVLSEEIESRKQRRIQLKINKANFPSLKSLDDYDFSGIKFPINLNEDKLQTLEFIEKKQNLILYGSVGTGKTHLATALGLIACKHDLKVKFYTVTSLVSRLSEAHEKKCLEKMIKDLSRLDLLILDEWGYVPIDRKGSQLLFSVIADSYEQKSLIITTNIEFSMWGSIFTDEQMAAAMIDRLVHHGYLLLFEGESYRLKHALMRQTINPNTD